MEGGGGAGDVHSACFVISELGRYVVVKVKASGK